LCPRTRFSCGSSLITRLPFPYSSRRDRCFACSGNGECVAGAFVITTSRKEHARSRANRGDNTAFWSTSCRSKAKESFERAAHAQNEAGSPWHAGKAYELAAQMANELGDAEGVADMTKEAMVHFSKSRDAENLLPALSSSHPSVLLSHTTEQ